jgi:hypothetical protein
VAQCRVSALVAFVFIRLFDVSLTVAACVFLAVFVVLTLTGSSFGGIWNSGLWTLLPVRRLVGAIADGAMFIATALFSWWLVVDVIDVPGLSFRLLDFLTHGQPDPALPKPLIMLLWTGMLLLVPFSAIPRFKTLIGKVAAPLLRPHGRLVQFRRAVPRLGPSSPRRAIAAGRLAVFPRLDRRAHG